MKIANAAGREYYAQRSKDNFFPKWTESVEPVRVDLDGTPVLLCADRDRSDYIYFRYQDTSYCIWARNPTEFDILKETSLQITDHGRRYGKRDSGRTGSQGKLPVQMPDANQPLTREDIEAVLVHLPELREKVAAREAEGAKPGVYSDEFSAAVRRVVRTFFEHRFMKPFNYQPWMDEAKRLMEDPQALGQADLETLRKLLVCHWRADYWDATNEHWEFIAESGHLTALLERLQEIAPTMPTEKDVITDSSSDTQTNSFSEFVPPDAEQYMEGLENIRERITPRQMEMLEAHYYAPGHSATMAQLAEKVGYEDFRAANAQYGRLASTLLQEMGLPAPLWRGKEAVWVLGIGDIVSETEFVMHPTLVEALERLGWVKGIQAPTVRDFVTAFECIRDRITPQQRAILLLNCVAGERGVTIGEIQRISGYRCPDPKLGWAIYQQLAQTVYEALGYSSDHLERLRDHSFWDLGLATAVPSDRDFHSGNYGVVLVMRPEVREALERLEYADNAPMADAERRERPESADLPACAVRDPDLPPGRVDGWEDIWADTDDSQTEIQDFIIYHNPDVMGPLMEDPTFEVLTNKSVSKARVGDRVWLITGEGTPRKYYLACWFYIDEFGSAEEDGFKHLVSGSEGENFSPLLEIPKEDWFTQLKHDQGNFAFGLSQIRTPGAVDGLKTLAGVSEADASPKGRGSLSLADLAVLAHLHSMIAKSVDPSTISLTEITLERMGIYIDFDVEAWTDEAKRLSGDAGQIGTADLLTLRKLLTYHRHQSRDPERPDQRDLGYWIDLALRGDLLAILSRFEALYLSAVQDRISEVLYQADDN